MILIKRKTCIIIKIYVCSLVRFGSVLKNQSKIWSDPAIFTKWHTNISKIFYLLRLTISLYG
jgi:predicted nucleotidyltransferase